MICLPGKVIVIITIPTTSIGRVESKFPTLGYPRSNNSRSMGTYEGTLSNHRNDNADRNAPIATNHRATNSDT